ncbi:protein phosphatase 2C domain-containing protein [Pseudomonas stutzeri]|uniref:PP2C family protein-serine/threonine phosphatase n=1 Tax=Stutzerimonas stutzeri TaxID=316 RepID=UPI00210EF25A|nr:protein phosphatase 2C domain-containing protein [Stutzerimonas stutzeri]MCQ4311662.1 protein phosphatase 2C domain-containing protein [Stutzerimonas stutzeri]
MLRIASASLLDFAGLTSPGRTRDHNEDALLCCPALGLWAVADGMGGHQYGEIASTLALQVLEQAVAGGDSLEAAVHVANRAVLEAAAQDGMGTTIVAAHFNGTSFELAWVGDSRAYRVTADDIVPLSRDHSWVQAMVDAGELDPADAQNHRWKNIILQCLGRDEALAVGAANGMLYANELLLLCSDGLTNELTDTQIHAQCTAADTLEAMVEQLIEQANAKGGRDNISCIVLGHAMSSSAESRGRRLLNKLFKPLKS